MALAKSARFKDQLEPKIEISLLTSEWPAANLTYRSIHLSLRGPSNKKDLLPKEIPPETDFSQFIYCDRYGNLYDAVLSCKKGATSYFLEAVATRPRPD